MIRYTVDTTGLNQLPRTIVPGLARVADSANRGSDAVSRFGSVIRGALAGFGLMALTKMADEWAGVEARVGLVTNGIDEQRYALAKLYGIAQATGQKYEATAGLFQSVQRNAKELNLTLDESLKLTDTIGKALTIGGGSQQSQQAALVQLGQALGSGTLRGEELNSVMEQAPRLAQAIAEAFNVPIGKLKDLGQAGKLTSKDLAAGLLKNAEKLNGEFDRMPLTFGRAFTRLGNSLGQQVDKFNKNTKAAELFYKATSLVVDNLGSILKWVAYLGAAAGLTKLLMAARATGGAVGLITRAVQGLGGVLAASRMVGIFIRMLAVITAIDYVFDDIRGWLRGDLSLIGDILGPTSDWKWLVDGIKDALKWVKKYLGDTTGDITTFVARWGLVGTIAFGIVAALGLIPTLILAALVGFAGLFNYIYKNWDAIKTYITKGNIGADLVTMFSNAWDTIKAKAIEVWNAIGKIISDAMPEFVRNGFNAQVNAVSNSAGAIGRFVTGAMPTRPGAVTNGGNVEQNATVNIYAQTNSPAAIGDAAQTGTRRGLADALVPMVETGP